MSKLRRSSATPLDDDSALMLIARHVLSGPSDEGRASYQIALSICPECEKGQQQASGELVTVGAEIVAMAACDGQHLGLLQPTAAAERASAERAHTGASRRATANGRRHGAHTGARAKHGAHTGARAKQTIPPATRRAVLRRDHQRCTVPGCKNARFLDLHHVELGSEGGSNQAANLITLCGAHHRAAHRGELIVTGSVVTGSVATTVRFLHADGSDYGQALESAAVQTQAKAFAALRQLGFREGETRRALAEIRTTIGDRPSLERVLREALAKLSTLGRT